MKLCNEPITDYTCALFNGSLINSSNVQLELTNSAELKPFLWIAAIEDPGRMQELILSNKYAQLLLMLYDNSLKEIKRLGMHERGVRSLIYRLGITEQLKQEAREMLLAGRY